MKDLVFKTIMLKGEGGTSIDRIEKTSSSGVVDTYTIYFDDDREPQTFEVTNGYSIISIEKTATLGNVDTYTVSLDNGDTYTFDVTNSNVADSMTAQDETTVGPSIHSVKDFINKVTEADGLLFCGDFVNVPNSAMFSDPLIPRSAHYALGWFLPDWLTWVDGKGLKIDKAYSGTYTNFLTPKYHNRSITLADLGIDKAIVSVEWSKDGDSEIHTSTKVINNTSTSYSWDIVELEPNIVFRIGNFYAYPDDDDFGGTTLFSINNNGNTIQGDYYIRKIKLEKGDIATPFGFNKLQFFALQVFYDFVKDYAYPKSNFLELTGNLNTDGDGETLISGALPSGWTINNTIIESVSVKESENGKVEVYTNNFYGSGFTGNKDVEVSGKLAIVNNEDCFAILFKDATRPNATLPYRITLRKSSEPFT